MTAALRENHALLLRCALLQALDVLTTLAFLARGIQEANPFVRWSMAASHGHLTGLLLVKCVACALAATAVRSGRTRVVARMNTFFVVLAGWNLLALASTFSAR